MNRMEQKTTDPGKTREEKPKRKSPLRKCVGCGQMKEKQSLLRVVRDTDGNVFIDRKGKANGRGAYLCGPACLKQARKARSLERSLGCSLSEQFYESLEQEMKAYEE